jgi:aryl-alcohol dehydrogenase-like predicted oxidoreductase
MVTRLGLGCAPLAGLFERVSSADARAVVDRAWERGVRLFDTAPLYGSGLSERRVGAALAARPRDELVLSTKVGRLLRAGGEPDPLFVGADRAAPFHDFSADAALRSLEGSLQRLGFERVDVALIHDPDDHLEEALAGSYAALERLRRAGSVGAIGVGMNQTQQLTRFVQQADVDCVLLAGRYTLLDTSALADLLPLCQERGIAVIAGGVLNSGILSGSNGPVTFDYAPAPQELRLRVRRIAAICERFGVPLAAAALQFPLAHPAVACLVVGCRSAAELTADADLLELELPDDLWLALKHEGLLPAEAPVPLSR